MVVAVVGVGGVPSDYLVSTQLRLWLFCCWGCGRCWAVTIFQKILLNYMEKSLSPHAAHTNAYKTFIENDLDTFNFFANYWLSAFLFYFLMSVLYDVMTHYPEYFGSGPEQT